MVSNIAYDCSDVTVTALCHVAGSGAACCAIVLINCCSHLWQNWFPGYMIHRSVLFEHMVQARVCHHYIGVQDTPSSMNACVD